MKTLLEVVEITTNDIAVKVKIDYINAKVSLVDEYICGEYKNKHWIFAERELGYMNSWIKILEAMKVGIEYGKKQLEKKLEEDSRLRDDIIIKHLDKEVKVRRKRNN